MVMVDGNNRREKREGGMKGGHESKEARKKV